MARPIPREAPVTNAVLSARFKMSLFELKPTSFELCVQYTIRRSARPTSGYQNVVCVRLRVAQDTVKEGKGRNPGLGLDPGPVGLHAFSLAVPASPSPAPSPHRSPPGTPPRRSSHTSAPSLTRYLSA